MGVCILATAGACGVAGLVALGVGIGINAGDAIAQGNGAQQWGGFLVASAMDLALAGVPGARHLVGRVPGAKYATGLPLKSGRAMVRTTKSSGAHRRELRLATWRETMYDPGFRERAGTQLLNGYLTAFPDDQIDGFAPPPIADPRKYGQIDDYYGF